MAKYVVPRKPARTWKARVSDQSPQARNKAQQTADTHPRPGYVAIRLDRRLVMEAVVRWFGLRHRCIER